MSGIALNVLLPETVERQWDELRVLLEPGVEHARGEFDVDDILTMVKDKKAFIAAMVQNEKTSLAVCFEVLEYPKKCVLHVLAMGGTGFDVIIKVCWEHLAELAQLVGASAIRGAVRPSMERYCRRVVPEAGKIYTILERGV